MRSEGPTVSDGSWVAAGMFVMNVVLYAFSVVAARLLVPAELGAVTALLGILLIGNVLSLGLQAATARRLAVDPGHSAEIAGAATRVMLVAGVLAGGALAALSPVVSPALKLDSAWPVVLCGLTLVPLTVMGAEAGIAQGTARWRLLAAIYVANGTGRLACGVVALLVDASATSAMVGVAIGAWAPVLVGAPLLLRSRSGGSPGRRRFAAEAALSTHALLAFFVLSSLDALIARNRFDVHVSGLYAAGLILTKAALFAPQFVSVVVFPDLARTATRAARARAAGAVLAIGGVAVALTFALDPVALALVGGDQYDAVQGRLWLFALSGSALAVVHLLVFDALARHAHGVTALLWAGVATLLAVAYGTDVGLIGLVSSVACIAAAIAVVAWLLPGDRPTESVKAS